MLYLKNIETGVVTAVNEGSAEEHALLAQRTTPNAGGQTFPLYEEVNPTEQQVADSNRTFIYFGDGTGSTLVLPSGVTPAFPSDPTATPGAYKQNGRACWFGAVKVDLDTFPSFAQFIYAAQAFVPIPPDFMPSSLEGPVGSNNILPAFVQFDKPFFPIALSACALDDGDHPEWNGFYALTPAAATQGDYFHLIQSDPAFPITGSVVVYLSGVSYDVAGA